MTVNVPSLKVKVRRRYLNPEFEGFEEAYLVAVTAIAGRPLLFHVHLKSGALFSRLPITALICEKFGATETSALAECFMQHAQPWSCLEGPVQAYVIEHLRDSSVSIMEGSGHYLFTVDYYGDGLAADPEQWKSHQVIVMDCGNLMALPNNKVLFVDQFFTQIQEFPAYQRQTKYWMAGS
jgi:hypothetical protein